MDDIDFDDVFQDDEEATAEHEVEDDDVKDGKDRVKKEIKGYSIGNQDEGDDDFDDMNKLTSEGKQMRKLVRDLEKNRAYESDEDADPYASSAEELDSDNDDEDKSENEKEKEKKHIPLKKKAVQANKPMMPKKAHTAKIKKEGLSKPIGRPGSPSIYMKKKENEKSNSPLGKPSPSSPLRSGPSPTPGSPSSSLPSKKRKMEDAPSPESKHKKVAAEEGLITEQEVIDTLRGKVMTLKEFLLSFRKRIKKDPRNRDAISAILKKVAKSNRSSDPNTRTLELRPEY